MDPKEYDKFLADRFKPNPINAASIRNQQAKVLRDFKKYVPDRDVKILDVGCHEGIGLKLLQRWGYKKAEGIEYLPLLVRAAIRKGCKVIQGDAHSMPFSENTFNAIFGRFVLEHCHTPSLVLQECSRVLKSDGVIYLVTSLDPEFKTEVGVSEFRKIDDFSTILPITLTTLRLSSHKNQMGWYNLIYVGKKQ
jgi:ubiquinone/menaquinone biosynthesis C-methylase UbiE